jgi:cytidine deaminase
MKQIQLTSVISILSWEELPEDAKKCIESAKDAASKAYAPYSHFLVGAAVMLDNDLIVTGNNQENAASPSGLCAERTAVFSANSQYPDSPVKILAIAAICKDAFMKKPITPCGSCRQVLLETEKRFGRKIRFYLYGTEKIFYMEGIENLLPLSFHADSFL